MSIPREAAAIGGAFVPRNGPQVAWSAWIFQAPPSDGRPLKHSAELALAQPCFILFSLACSRFSPMQKLHHHLTEMSDQQALELLHQSVADVRRLANRSLQMIIDTEEALGLASKMESPLIAQPRGGARSLRSR
jgi:hypothetical protein